MVKISPQKSVFFKRKKYFKKENRKYFENNQEYVYI